MAGNRKFTRPVLGDIVEIPLTKGFAYAQYIYNHTTPPRWGTLLRIFPGIFEERPKEFSDLIEGGERFLVFFPLAAAVNQKMVALVEHAPVPERLKSLPIFKAAGPRNASGIVLNWWLWDGEKAWRVPSLTEDEKKYPLKEIVTPIPLVKRIESGWKPEDEVRELPVKQ